MVPKDSWILKFSSRLRRARSLAWIAREPPQRLGSYGAAALSESELAFVLKAGLRIEESRVLARTMITETGSIAPLSNWQTEEFRRIFGATLTRPPTISYDD